MTLTCFEFNQHLHTPDFLRQLARSDCVWMNFSLMSLWNCGKDLNHTYSFQSIVLKVTNNGYCV